MLVSWDDEIPNIWKNKKKVPNHQPEIILGILLVNTGSCIIQITSTY
jgi:hypothetical protein